MLYNNGEKIIDQTTINNSISHKMIGVASQNPSPKNSTVIQGHSCYDACIYVKCRINSAEGFTIIVIQSEKISLIAQTYMFV